ncbi:MAG TPA: hypothetical protein VFM23_03660 [Gemmatimonadales bacterium]|nr:hypothetical protein [Gemmatimonadales bacterium]
MWPRIQRSRVLGVRVAGQQRSIAIPWRWLAAAAIAGVLIGGSWIVSLSLSKLGRSSEMREPFGDWLRRTGMLPPDDPRGSMSEVPPPRYAVITTDDLDVTRLTEGTWHYTETTTTDDVLTRLTGKIAIRLVRSNYQGRPAFMVNQGEEVAGIPWGLRADTTHLDAASLRPLRTVAYGKHVRFLQTFSADSGYEAIVRTGPMPLTRSSWTALPFSHDALFINDWSTTRLAVLLGAFPLARRWSGSLYQVGYITQVPQRSNAPIDLRVVGTDRVTVPAGTFDCWRLTVETHLWRGERETFWVSRDDGWLIKRERRYSDVTVATQLTSYEPGS